MTRFQVKTDDIAWRVVDGEAVIVHALTSVYYGLNSTGTVIWEALVAGPQTADEIVGSLFSEAGVPSDQVRPEVDAFLMGLVRADLVTETHAQEGGAGPGSYATKAISIDTYEAPALAPFGELEQLILSGE